MEIDIEAYYVKYGPMVLRRCRQILKDTMQAEDAMQEVFIRLMNYQHKLKGEYPSSLLYRMATNVCLNIIRSESRKKMLTEGDDLLNMIACYDEKHEKVDWKDFFNKLFHNEKAGTQTIAMLHWVDGLTLEETAEAVGMSVSGIRKRLRLFREKVTANSKLKLPELI